MASLIDSVRTIINGSHPFVKVTALSILVFIVTQTITVGKLSEASALTLGIVCALILFGYYLETIHNSINDNLIILPKPHNIIKHLWIGVNGVISLFPYIAILYYGMQFVNPFLSFQPWINIVIQIIVFALLFSFFSVGMLLFCKDFNPIAGYKIGEVLKYAGDFVVCNLILLLSLALLIGVVFVPIGIGMHLMFDYGLVFDFYVIYSIIFILLFVCQYYSQLHFEYIDLDK